MSLYSPKYPMTTWKMAETAMAPWTSLILRCHSSVLTSSDALPHPLTEKSAGHWFAGRLRIAKVGARKAKVPPWTMGSL